MKKSRKSINNKRRVAQKFTESSESSEEEQEASLRKVTLKFTETKMKIFVIIYFRRRNHTLSVFMQRARNSQINENADPGTRYTMTLRKRQKIETASNRILRRGTTKSR